MDGVTVTKFTFLHEMPLNWIKYMKHWFSRYCISGEVLFHPKSLPTEAHSIIGRHSRELINLSSRCTCHAHSSTRIISVRFRGQLASMPHPEVK